MGKDIILKSGWVKIDKAELDLLRKKLREIYEKEGGSKKFNAHLPNYEELREIITAKLNELKESQNIDIKIQDLSEYDIIPGNTFFRNLLYTNKNAKSIQFQEYNIDVCYLFSYGKKRFEQLRYRKKLGPEPAAAEFPQKYKIIISSTINNMTEADKIKNRLQEEFAFDAETEVRDTHAFSKGTFEDLYESLPENTIIFSLISRDYLQNESCVRDLIDFTNENIDLYLKHTLHIILDDVSEGDFNIFDSLGRSELLKYWKLRSEKLEENHKLILNGKKDREIYKMLSKELKEIKSIIEELNTVLDIIRASKNKILYKIFLTKIDKSEELINLFPKSSSVHIIASELEKTYKGIKIPSTNNPQKPEFPPLPFYKPKFPATQTRRIDVPGFKNVWMKDESTNPTGTHKDRMAWEVVIKYKSLIQGLKYKDYLPQMSIISSGSAAIAIQHFLNLFEIPAKLKVLVDKSLSEKIKRDISEIGCELYESDLSEKLLATEEIKELTVNPNGIDITYREVLDPAHDTYYDWMSYEILREKPEYCLIPFGTGDLFINVLNIVKMEYFNSFVPTHDPRFFGDISSLKKCHFFGASSRLANTKMDKLYSSFLPSIDSFKKYINQLKNDYSCVGERTGIYYIEEGYVDEAIAIADSQKLIYEPSGLAGLALLLQMQKSFPKDARILIVNTGKTKELKELKK